MSIPAEVHEPEKQKNSGRRKKEKVGYRLFHHHIIINQSTAHHL